MPQILKLAGKQFVVIERGEFERLTGHPIEPDASTPSAPAAGRRWKLSRHCLWPNAARPPDRRRAEARWMDPGRIRSPGRRAKGNHPSHRGMQEQPRRIHFFKDREGVGVSRCNRLIVAGIPTPFAR